MTEKKHKTINYRGDHLLLLDANEKGEVECPFCRKKHKHGNGGGNGHRIAHCNSAIIITPILQNGKWFRQSDGYYVNFKNESK